MRIHTASVSRYAPAAGWAALYVAINALVVVKQAGRMGLSAPAAAAAYVALAGGLLALAVAFTARRPSPGRAAPDAAGRGRRAGIAAALVAGVATVLLVWAQSRVDPYTLQVDRWSAIHNFLEHLLAGEYPYAARTHLGGYGSPFPVWQLVHLPFYLLFHNVGLSSVVTLALFVHSTARARGGRAALAAALLLYASPAVVYEVTVRSDLMANFLAVGALINYLAAAGFDARRRPVAAGVIGGLLLATRWSAVVPWGLWLLMPFVQMGGRARVRLIVAAVLTFAAAFAPFLLWDGAMLLSFDYNPFVLQSRQGNVSDLLLFVPLGVALGWWTGGRAQRAMGASALMLTLVVAGSFVHDMSVRGDWDQLLGGTYDLTYFHMGLPFCVAALAGCLAPAARQRDALSKKS